MRILHVGGNFSITATLSKYQVRQGHEVSVLGHVGAHLVQAPDLEAADLQELLGKLDAGIDVITFHQSSSLLQLVDLAARENANGQILDRIFNSGASFYYYSYGADALHDDLVKRGVPWTEHEILRNFKHVFIGDAENAAYSLTGSWSWLPIPIDLEYVPPPEQREIKKGQLRIAHIPFDLTDSDSGKISAAFEQLKAQKMGFTYSLIPPEEITNPIKLYLAFNQCDLFVEQFARRSFGYLALEAMALGKTVMSGNAVALRKPWNNLDLAPVLDTNENMLMRRLESIIKEPLCLRDLCKRSRAYVENYHCADVIVAQMVEVYRRSQTRPSLFAGA